MKNSISEELRKYKKLIIAYTALCIVTAVFVSPFFGVPHFQRVHAFGGSENISVGETTENLATEVSGKTLKKIAGSYSPIISSCCEPFSAMLFIGVLDFINQKATNGFLEMEPTILGNWPVLIVIGLFFVASKVMKSNGTTKVLGECTLGELEKYLGLVFCIVIGVMNVINVGVNFNDSTVSAAGLYGSTMNTFSNVARGIGLTAFSVLMSVGSLIIFIIGKIAFSGIDALQACFSYIPFTSAAFEIVKSLFSLGFTFLNVRFPEIAIYVDIIVFIICLLIFRFCWKIEEFIRHIYIKPLFARVRGFNDEIPLVNKKLPKKIKRMIEKDYGTINLALPAFSFKKKEADNFKMKVMQKIWVVSTDTETFFVAKRAFGRLQKYQLSSRADGKQYYMKKDFRFLEIFSNPAGKSIHRKDLRVILSVEYTHRFDEIISRMGITDFHQHMANEKLNKKELRRVKREQRKEALIEKSNKFSEGFVDLFTGRKIMEKQKENNQ